MRVRPCTCRATQRRAHDDGAVCGGLLLLQDKEKVAAYRASIKDQLTKAGMIRGQLRPTYMQPAVVPSQRSGIIPGPGPRTLQGQSPRGPEYAAPSWGTEQYPSTPGGIHTMPGEQLD